MNTTTFSRFGLAAVVFLRCAFGQSDAPLPQPRPRFEVASVKASKSQYGGCKVTPFRMNCTGYGLDTLILGAYAQSLYLVQGLPSWANNAFYDINAVLEGEGSPAVGKQENFRLLMLGLQGLLEERFGLRSHHESQLRPGLRLAAAKGGLKLKPTAGANTVYLAGIVKGREVIEYRNYAMATFASVLSFELERPVVDATGAEGRYDFEIQLEPDEHRTNRSVSDALGNFGLRLEAGKYEFNVFVIDRLERPADN